MTIHRIKIKLMQFEQRFSSDQFRRKLVIGTMLGIFVLFLFSVYVFSRDLALGISKENEEFARSLQNAAAQSAEEDAEEAPETVDNGMVKPQKGATPVPLGSEP